MQTQLPVLQLLEFPDRIINPLSIRRAGWLVTGTDPVLQIVLQGGHSFTITNTKHADQSWQSLIHGPYLQHARWLYNPMDIAQVVKDSPTEVSVFFITGDYIIVRDDPMEFYGKWQTYKNQNDAIIQAAIAQQQAAMGQQIVQSDPLLMDAYKKTMRRN